MQKKKLRMYNVQNQKKTMLKGKFNFRYVNKNKIQEKHYKKYVAAKWKI